MKSLMLIFLLHVLLQIMRLPTSQCEAEILQPMDANLMEQTCKQTHFHDLCVSTLQSNGGISSSDVQGLAIIMVKVLQANATETLGHIYSLLQGNPKPGDQVKQALSSCADKYDAVLKADVSVAMEALTKGDYKFALTSANDAANEVASCEAGFSGNSPLTAMNTLVREISVVVSDMVELLLQ
ncbi:Cell wall / vacuolar inhibitor of fructosidase 1 [Morella rubra]|uniref:Cell wall / vacuolar inhibitor of fructosidase 1 n=1 Tax=Morella rubra TaxID=262757 RepID=A0A6A1WM53_9ROSI|nr:Cell wall / vacuolar inhibitor of fructosidase 1 [Morella rubra]